MKKIWLLLAGLVMAFPVLADEVPDEEATPVEEAPPAEAPVEEAAAPVEEAPVEEAPVEEAPAEEEEPMVVYVGADRAKLFVSFSDEALKTRFGGSKFASNFYKVRAGVRVFEVVGLEVQYGQGEGENDDRPGRLTTDSYWGFYAVPTGTFMDVLEVGVPVGYSWVNVKNHQDVKYNFERVSFGLNLEVPFRAFGDDLPDLRIGGGGMVYQAENHARAYGVYAGLRMDFRI